MRGHFFFFTTKMADKNTSQIPYKNEIQDSSQIPYKNENQRNTSDWKLFMWFASLLEKIENCIYLYIIVWNSIPVRNSTAYTKEFNEETDDMIRIVREINMTSANSTEYSEILDNYRKYRYSSTGQDQDARSDLVDNIWARLESCGLRENPAALVKQLRG